jgi:membrane fusion protein YbhG
VSLRLSIKESNANWSGEVLKKKIVPIVLLLLIGAGLYFYFRNQKPKNTNRIRVSGNIEVTDAALSFKTSGRVTERLVSEGDTVTMGQVVAKVDDTDLQQQVNVRKAELEAAQAALQELLAGSRPEEIGQAEAALARVQAEENRWRQDYERHQDLYKQGVISKNELDASELNYETARTRVLEAQKSLRLVQKGPRIEKIDQARADVRRAEEALALAQTLLSYATLSSPMAGIVLTQNIEPGEYVSPGTPVVTVGKLDTVWLRAFIDETDLGRVHLGQTVRVKTDTFPGKIYEGKVSFISSESEFTPKTVQTDKERVKLVYRIKIDIANPQMQLKPGMPADGEVIL